MKWIERFLRYKRRSLKFTPLGTRFVLVTLAVGLAAINTGNNLLYLVLALLLSLITLSGVLSEQCLRRLVVTRRLPSVVFASEPYTATLIVANHKRLFPSFLLHVQEEINETAGVTTVGAADPPIFVLPPHAVRSISYRAQFGRRGLHRLTGVVASTDFPFGLFTKRLLMPLAHEVLVYPAMLPNAELAGVINPVGQELARARKGRGGGFFALRDYQEGDDARMIHWKSSARHAKLLVREVDEEEHREVTLVIERRWPSDATTEGRAAIYRARFERAISLGATMTVEWARRGWRLGIVTEEVHLPPAQGRAHLEKILRTLTLLPPIERPPPSDEPLAIPTQLLSRRPPDQLWVVLAICDDDAWPTGMSDVLRHVVTCPNEPTESGEGEA